THTHSLNVSVYALCLGAALGLKEEKLVPLGRAALLHDLGKSKINYEVINKNGVLSQEEFEEMKSHPSLGYDIAINIGINDKNILDGIRHHHEKLDGNGYPDNLKEHEIKLFPRIIGICDVFDALTTRRSYKEAIRSFNALQIMKLEMNAHLDMKILNVFIKMLHK
ncbi:MAG: HD domain-containing protein, partial [Sulfurimonas sp.]|nr:HD domain-containing protein [Sulfurimonas sp.]